MFKIYTNLWTSCELHLQNECTVNLIWLSLMRGWFVGMHSTVHSNDVILSAMVYQITTLTICLLNRLFRRRSKKTSKLRVTGLCEGNSPVTGEFPTQRASNAENGSIWWRHHATLVALLDPTFDLNIKVTDNQKIYVYMVETCLVHKLVYVIFCWVLFERHLQRKINSTKSLCLLSLTAPNSGSREFTRSSSRGIPIVLKFGRSSAKPSTNFQSYITIWTVNALSSMFSDILDKKPYCLVNIGPVCNIHKNSALFQTLVDTRPHIQVLKISYGLNLNRE